MKIKAGVAKKSFSTDKLQYVEGTASTRKHDSCYYQLVADLTEDELSKLKEAPMDGVKIHVKVKKADQMNVYLYGGKDRASATSKIVDENANPEVDEEYVFDYAEGIMIVAYPNKDQATNFEFEYWVGAYEEPGFFSFKGDVI